jgi:serine/threonine protein phosphatase 1
MTSHKPRVQRFVLNATGRDFAVGDIHGCFSALEAALRHVGFSPDSDRLFSVGDLVDRGSESDQVVD